MPTCGPQPRRLLCTQLLRTVTLPPFAEFTISHGVPRGHGRQNLNRPGSAFAHERIVSEPKRFVYVLRSVTQPGRWYTGLTSNPEQRLEAHNMGLSAHTASGTPWRRAVAIEFDDEVRAAKFERYLKSGSGRVFAQRHFRP
jgi:putative endonuclease